MGKNYNEKQKQAIEEAVKYVKENLNVIKSNENFKKFSNERKDIFALKICIYCMPHQKTHTL